MHATTGSKVDARLQKAHERCHAILTICAAVLDTIDGVERERLRSNDAVLSRLVDHRSGE